MTLRLIGLLTIFNLIHLLCYSQKQWFPTFIDTETKQYVVDSSGAFPVSFIEFKNKKMYMCGYHTNYRTSMKLVNGIYYSPFLIIPLQEKTILYSKAKYYFKIEGLKGRLIIKLENKSDTIMFIRSSKPHKEINGKWG